MKKNSKVLKPIEPKEHWSWGLARQISDVFYEGIYKDLFELMKHPMENSGDDVLIRAIRSGQVRYLNGKISGDFNSAISKILREYGAEFDARSKVWLVQLRFLPSEVQNAIYAAATQTGILRSVMDAVVDKAVGRVNLLVKGIDLTAFSDQTTDKITKKFKATVTDVISVQPSLTAEIAIRVDENYVKAMTRPIKKKLTAMNYTNVNNSANYFAEEEVVKLREGIDTWVRSGKSRKGLQQMIQYRLNISKDRAKFIARQETALFTSEFKQAQYQSAGIKKYIWQSVHDSRTRHRHAELDGKIFRFDQPPVVDIRTQQRGNPGEDFNCVISGTNIDFYSSVKKSFKRLYVGPIVKITDETGVEVSVTLNHPVLTLRGWVFAKDLNTSDKLLKSLRPDILMILNKEVDHRHVPTADEIHDFLSVSFLSKRLGTFNHEFHGDVTHSEVDVVTVDSSLSVNFESVSDQVLKDLVFASTYTATSFSHSQGGSSDLLGCFLNASSSIVSFPDLVSADGRSHARPLEFLRFRLIPDLDAVLDQAGPDDISRRLEQLSDLILAHKFDRIKMDDLLNVEILAVPGSGPFFISTQINALSHENYSGDVFNFETDSGTYIANGILLSNCRCQAKPIVEF